MKVIAPVKKEEMNLEITKLQKGEEKHWESK